MHRHEATIRRCFAACNAGDHAAKVLLSGDEAVIEWTHWKRNAGTAQRGDEWYAFDAATGLIREIRAYCAAPAVKDIPIEELVDFDYAGRGYHLNWNHSP